jgi:hypothetical protein
MRNVLLCPTDWPHHTQGAWSWAAAGAYIWSDDTIIKASKQEAEPVEHTDSLESYTAGLTWTLMAELRDRNGREGKRKKGNLVPKRGRFPSYWSFFVYFHNIYLILNASPNWRALTARSGRCLRFLSGSHCPMRNSSALKPIVLSGNSLLDCHRGTMALWRRPSSTSFLRWKKMRSIEAMCYFWNVLWGKQL